MKKNKAKEFWDWFARFNTVYLWLPAIREKDGFAFWINEINAQLKNYGGPGLAALFNWQEEKDTATLIVTAGGKQELFSKIDQLISEAPALKAWQFQALIPPLPMDHGLIERHGDLGINLELMRCRLLPDTWPGTERGIEIFAEIYNPTIDKYRTWIEAVVFNVLGERAMAHYVGDIEIKWLFTLPPERRAGLRKMMELPSLLIPDHESGMEQPAAVAV